MSKAGEYRNFNMTLEECRLVLDTFRNLVIVDEKGRIHYLSPDMYFMIEAYNKQPVPEHVAGRHISDVHYVSKITSAIDTGKGIRNAFYFSSGVTNVARIKPLYSDGSLKGAIDYDLFTDGHELKQFIDQLDAHLSGKKMDQLEWKIRKKNTIPSSYRNFDMTLDECRMVFDAIDYLVITDEKGITKYMSPDLYPFLGKDKDAQTAGLPIEEVNEHSRVREVLETGKPLNAAFYGEGDELCACRIEPVYQDGKLVGAIDYDLFTSGTDLTNFRNQVKEYSEIGILNYESTFESMYASIKKSNSVKYTINHILGDSRAVKKLRMQITDVSENNATVLITGKTGTGKELVAHAIHNLSLRADQPIVAVNCAAIPENLFESELFGYEEGSFTGASKGGKVGYFEQADGGTLFLDEVDQLPYHVQPKLLRVLQEKEVTPIGGRAKPVNIRLIAATNKDLLKLVGEAAFREDLYYRLNVVNIHIPPLKERKEDIPILAQFQMKRLNNQLLKRVKNISDEVMTIFMGYDWPGNIRELFNVLERCMVTCRGETLQVEDLGDFISSYHSSQLSLPLDQDAPLEEVRNRAEKAAIIQVLEMTGGNKARTAALLKISRTALYEKLKKYELM